MNFGERRHFLSLLGLGGLVSGLGIKTAEAHHTDSHFEEKAAHKLVYQCNKADEEYLGHILFSCSEMLRKYGDDIELVITALGPGLNLLGKKPKRPVSTEHQQKAQSLAEYGVRFQACGNTMKSFKWTKKDLFDFAEVVPIGVDGIMKLQEEGFCYLSW